VVVDGGCQKHESHSATSRFPENVTMTSITSKIENSPKTGAALFLVGDHIKAKMEICQRIFFLFYLLAS
jgi:hypothetical protein